MTKTDIQQLAADVFKSNPSAKTVFITSDGFPFLTKNAAELHKNTNRGTKKLEVIEVKNEAFPSNEGPAAASDKPLAKMNKAELLEVAVSKGIEAPADATKAEIIKLIEAVTEIKSEE